MNAIEFNNIGAAISGKSVTTLACGLEDAKQYLELHFGTTILKVIPNKLNLDIEISEKKID